MIKNDKAPRVAMLCRKTGSQSGKMQGSQGAVATCRVKLTLLGNRYNGFGQLHLIGDDIVWLGPDSFRSCGDSFTGNYNVIPMGIMSEPIIC